MKFDASDNTLGFASRAEAEEFHLQLSALVRTAMVQATRHIEDPAEAKDASRGVMKEMRAVVRALNALRSTLPRKTF
jgi:hypothetical protein